MNRVVPLSHKHLDIDSPKGDGNRSVIRFDNVVDSFGYRFSERRWKHCNVCESLT